MNVLPELAKWIVMMEKTLTKRKRKGSKKRIKTWPSGVKVMMKF